MSIFVEEKFLGRTRSSGRSASAEIVYIITATAGEDEDAAETALLAQAPATYHGLIQEGIGFFEEIKTGDGLLKQVWQASIRYTGPGDIQARPPGTSRTRFRTTGGTQHFTHSQITRAAYTHEGDPTILFNNAVGVNGDQVEGFDKYVPVFEWHENHVFTPEQMTEAYISTLYNLTGTVNREPWRIFDSDEALFLGAEGEQRDDNNWEVDFGFAASKTVEIPMIGGITGNDGGPIIKRGWDYLWVYYLSDVDSLGKHLIPIPYQVNIEIVYDWSDFISLNIDPAPTPIV